MAKENYSRKMQKSPGYMTSRKTMSDRADATPVGTVILARTTSKSYRSKDLDPRPSDKAAGAELDAHIAAYKPKYGSKINGYSQRDRLSAPYSKKMQKGYGGKAM